MRELIGLFDVACNRRIIWKTLWMAFKAAHQFFAVQSICFEISRGWLRQYGFQHYFLKTLFASTCMTRLLDPFLASCQTPLIMGTTRSSPHQNAEKSISKAQEPSDKNLTEVLRLWMLVVTLRHCSKRSNAGRPCARLLLQ